MDYRRMCELKALREHRLIEEHKEQQRELDMAKK